MAGKGEGNEKIRSKSAFERRLQAPPVDTAGRAGPARVGGSAGGTGRPAVPRGAGLRAAVTARGVREARASVCTECVSVASLRKKLLSFFSVS